MKKMNKHAFTFLKKGLLVAALSIGVFAQEGFGQCTAITTFPWTEEFSNGSLPSSCWTNTCSSSTSTNALWKFSGSPGYGSAPTYNGKTSGTFAWVDASSPYASIHDVTLITPEFDVSSLTTPFLRFEWFKNNEYPNTYDNNQLSVEVSDDNGVTWTSVWSDTSNAAQWRYETVSLASYANSTIEIKFVVDKDLNGNGYFYDDLLLDNITLMESPTCFPPDVITYSSLTSSSVTVNWNTPSVSPGSGYQYYYSTSNTTPTISTTPSGSTTTTSANITGLSANTTYYVWVRSLCSSTDTSEWSLSPVVFTTPCDAVTTLPWTEGFEGLTSTGTGIFPSCWYKESGNYWGTTNSTSYNVAHGGSNYLRDNYNAYNDYIWSPPISLTAGTTYAYTFYMQGDGYTSPHWGVGAYVNTAQSSSGATQLGSDFAPPGSNSLTYGSSPYEKKTFYFTPTTTGNYYFGLRVDSDGWPWYLAFDDFSVDVAPTCLEPDGLAVSTLASTSATVTWNAPPIVPGNGYQYYYNTTGVAPTASTTASGSVTTNSATLTLSQNTQYYLWVRSMCSSTDTSVWSSVLAFRTLQVPATLPYSDNFTSTSGNWTMLGNNQPNAWVVGSATGNTGNSMYVSNDGGTSNAYTTSYAASVSQSYRDIVLPSVLNPFNVAFDWKSIGEADFYSYGSYYYDYLTVWVMPRSYNPTPGTEINQYTTNAYQLGDKIGDFTATSGTWHNDHFVLPNSFAGDTIRLVFQWTNDTYSGTEPPAAIDNVNVSIITCITPDSLVANNITTTTADLNWATPAITPGTGYDYYYNTTGTAPTFGTTVSGSTTNTFATLSSLTQNTTYYVWVRSVCSSTDKSYWSSTPLVFTTECSTADVPYTVPLSTVTTPDLPDCLSAENLNPYSGSPWFSATGYPGSSYGFSGKYLQSDYTYYGDGPVDNWVYTNKINMNAGTYYKLSFKYGNNSSYSTEKLAVAYGLAATSDSMSAPVFDDTTIQFAGSKDTNVYFTVPTTGAYYIGFHAHSDEDQYYLFLSNITVDSMPTCYVANSLIANNITTNSASLAWFGTALQYNIEYGPTGFTQGTGTMVNSTTGTYQLGNLTPNTTYDFYVQDVCLPGAIAADWSAVGTFTTLCDVPFVNVGHDTSYCEGGSVTLFTGNTDSGATILWNNGTTADSIVANATGTYYATVTNRYGCSATDSAFIDVKAYPVINLGDDTSICGGDVLTLNAGSQPLGTSFFWNTTQTSQSIQVSDSGWYKVIADNLGCVTMDSIHVATQLKPTVNGITGSLNANGSFSFIAMGAQHVDNYYWDFGDGSNATGINPDHTYDQAGNYQVTLIVSNECGSDTVTTAVYFSGTGIHQIDLSKDQLKLYPNPARDIVTLKNESSYKMESVEVYNVLGQIVFRGETNNAQEYQLNVQSYASGMYNVKVFLTNGSWVQRKFEIRK